MNMKHKHLICCSVLQLLPTRAANISFDDMQGRILAQASIKSLIPPQQLADLAVYLASPRASTISGQAFAVDGDMQSLA